MSREEMDALAKERLVGIARTWYDQIRDGIVPFIRLPTRTKLNIAYDDESEVWKYGDRESTRAATTEKGAAHLLKMAYLVWFLKKQLVENRSSTLRELYYISEGWKKAKFGAQDESNLLIEDLEIITEVQREAFHLRPEEDGASLFGPLKIRETTRRGVREMHCQEDVGEAGLMENGFDEEYGAILVHLKGQPARSTRRVLRKLNDSLNLPVVVFTDGDPWSYRIYASVAYGSIKSAHMSELLATPQAQFIGVQPSDISDYNLPSDHLTEQDINALKAELTDPRFATDYWHNQIHLQLDMKVKSEQQAFASRGLDFVTKEYLPTRLSEMGVI
jgi:DNA topoisomerase-6 subunit A